MLKFPDYMNDYISRATTSKACDAICALLDAEANQKALPPEAVAELRGAYHTFKQTLQHGLLRNPHFSKRQNHKKVIAYDRLLNGTCIDDRLDAVLPIIQKLTFVDLTLRALELEPEPYPPRLCRDVIYHLFPGVWGDVRTMLQNGPAQRVFKNRGQRHKRGHAAHAQPA